MIVDMMVVESIAQGEWGQYFGGGQLADADPVMANMVVELLA